MIFRIYRTSDWESHNKPCEQAVAITIPATTNRVIEDNETGAYETIEEKTTKTVWIIEINSIDELIVLRNSLDEELILTNPNWTGYYGIEIYDDYRE